VRLVNGREQIRLRHVPAPLARLLLWIVRDLPGALVDRMLDHCTADSTRTVTAFHLKLTSLGDAWTVA
jgi:hypothetical protein